MVGSIASQGNRAADAEGDGVWADSGVGGIDRFAQGAIVIGQRPPPRTSQKKSSVSAMVLTMKRAPGDDFECADVVSSPCGRATPRWSVEGALFGGLNVTPSIAGLPVSRAKVWVSAQLFASAPSNGLVLLFEPDTAPQPHVVPLSMLLPPLVIGPPQFPPDAIGHDGVAKCHYGADATVENAGAAVVGRAVTGEGAVGNGQRAKLVTHWQCRRRRGACCSPRRCCW